MTYSFKCTDCDFVDDIAFDSIAEYEEKKEEVKCSKCGKIMKRSWGCSVIIPEYMKATNEKSWKPKWTGGRKHLY